MREVDLHGKLVDEALTEVEAIVNEIRIARKSEQLRIITGQGKIKKELVSLLKNLDVAADAEVYNTGSIIISIE